MFFIIFNEYYLLSPVYIFPLLRQCMYILFSLFLKKPSIISFSVCLRFRLLWLNRISDVMTVLFVPVTNRYRNRIVDTISILHDIDRGYESLVFIAMNDSYSRNLWRPCPSRFLSWFWYYYSGGFTVHKDCSSVGSCKPWLLHISMFSIFCNMTDWHKLCWIIHHSLLIYLSVCLCVLCTHHRSKLVLSLLLAMFVFDLIGLWIECNYIILVCVMGFLYCNDFNHIYMSLLHCTNDLFLFESLISISKCLDWYVNLAILCR